MPPELLDCVLKEAERFKRRLETIRTKAKQHLTVSKLSS